VRSAELGAGVRPSKKGVSCQVKAADWYAGRLFLWQGEKDMEKRTAVSFPRNQRVEVKTGEFTLCAVASRTYLPWVSSAGFASASSGSPSVRSKLPASLPSGFAKLAFRLFPSSTAVMV